MKEHSLQRIWKKKTENVDRQTDFGWCFCLSRYLNYFCDVCMYVSMCTIYFSSQQLLLFFFCCSGDTQWKRIYDCKIRCKPPPSRERLNGNRERVKIKCPTAFQSSIRIWLRALRTFFCPLSKGVTWKWWTNIEINTPIMPYIHGVAVKMSMRCD